MSTINELSNLKDRRALITGASGGLGQVIAETLGELGADLLLIDRDNKQLKELSDRLEKKWQININYEVCDLERQDQRLELIKLIKDNNLSINILVNNAAFVGTSDLTGWAVPFEEQTLETWRRALEVNLTAIFELCQKLYPVLKIENGSSIINISSIYGLYAPDWSLYEGTTMSNPAAYNASKGGLLQLTRWLATNMAPHVRVNAISPGGIFRNQPEIFVKRYEKKTPLQRMATEDDFRGTIAYLASDLSKYITGQNLIVDGGWGIW
ncbi:MAG: SDR family oxidoreductase [Thiothrix sp.]|nr:MAG: SDR family oxidoreductase [Thiothrix sp.]